MKNTESVIKIIKDLSAPANKDWAHATGQEQFWHDDYFQHIETKVEYSWLSGGLSWPVLAAQEKGCAVIIGCSRDDDPVFTVVDAGFSMTTEGTIHECVRLRDKWDGGGSALFSSFVGPDEYQQMRVGINNELEKGHPKQRGIILRNPTDWDDKGADQTYLNAIIGLSADNRLEFEVVPVRDALRGVTAPDADKKLSDNPTVAATTYTLYELITLKPWFSSGSGKPFILE